MRKAEGWEVDQRLGHDLNASEIQVAAYLRAGGFKEENKLLGLNMVDVVIEPGSGKGH